MKLGVSKKIIIAIIGALLIALATFSVLGIVANQQKKIPQQTQAATTGEYTFIYTYDEEKETWLKDSDDNYKNNEIFYISNSGGLMNFSKSVGDGGCTFEGKEVRLTCDIDMTGYNFIPIGADLDDGEYDTDAGEYFSGTFNGNNCTVSNLETTISTVYINSSLVGGFAGSIGFFAVAYGTSEVKAYVNSLKIKNFNLSIESGSYLYLGGIVGQAHDTIIENCVVENFSIKGNNSGYGINSGSICGNLYKGIIKNCYGSNFSLNIKELKQNYNGFYNFVNGISYISPIYTSTLTDCVFNNGADFSSNWNITPFKEEESDHIIFNKISNKDASEINVSNSEEGDLLTNNEYWHVPPSEEFNNGYPYLKSFMEFHKIYFKVYGGDEVARIRTTRIGGNTVIDDDTLEVPKGISIKFDKTNLNCPIYYGCLIEVYGMKANYQVKGWDQKGNVYYAKVADASEKCEVTFKFNTNNHHQKLQGGEVDVTYQTIQTGSYLTKTSQTTNYGNETTTYYFKVSYYDEENILRDEGLTITYTVNMCYGLVSGQEEIFIHGPMTIDMVFATEYFEIRFERQDVNWQEDLGFTTTKREGSYSPQYYILEDGNYVENNFTVNTTWGLSVMKNSKIKAKIENGILYYQLKVYDDLYRKTYDMLVVYELGERGSTSTYGYVDVENKTVTDVEQFTFRPTDTDISAEEIYVEEHLTIAPTFVYNIYDITFQDVEAGDGEIPSDSPYDKFVKLTDDEDDSVNYEFTITGVYGGSEIKYVESKTKVTDGDLEWYDYTIKYYLVDIIGNTSTIATYTTDHSVFVEDDGFVQYKMSDAIISRAERIECDLTIKPVFRKINRKVTFNIVEGMELMYNGEPTTESLTLDVELEDTIMLSTTTREGITTIKYRILTTGMPTVKYKILDKRYCLGNYGLNPQSVDETTSATVTISGDIEITPEMELKRYEIQYPITNQEK